MEGPITRAEHEEFRRRMEDEHQRTSKRLTFLEESVREIQTLALSVEKLAANAEAMCKELTRQGERLDAIENRDGETWRQLKYYGLTAAVSLVLGFLAKSISL